MEINATMQNGICVLDLTGRMDATTVSSFEEACKAELEKGNLKIIVNMKNLEYISSAGLRGILIMEKTSKAMKASIVFCHLQSMVSEVFKISGFNSILQVVASFDEAVNILK